MNKVTDFFSRFNTEYFFAVPVESKVVYAFLIFYIVLMVSVFFLAKRVGEINQLYRKFSKTFFWINFSLGTTGIFLVFNRYEQVSIFSWRFWQYLLISIIVLTNTYFYLVKKPQLERESEVFLAKKRKEKWLKSPKKKKK